LLQLLHTSGNLQHDRQESCPLLHRKRNKRDYFTLRRFLLEELSPEDGSCWEKVLTDHMTFDEARMVGSMAKLPSTLYLWCALAARDRPSVSNLKNGRQGGCCQSPKVTRYTSQAPFCSFMLFMLGRLCRLDVYSPKTGV
jgi:hypothetical protein